MPRALKIFASHGGAVANSLLRALETDRLVGRFVDAYVAEFDRRVLEDPARYRELLTTIGREALLVMVGRVYSELHPVRPRARGGASADFQAEGTGAFFQELLASLARGLRWSKTDLGEFRRDLDFYAHAPASAFADRCALLLDPSMLEQARHAAIRFQVEIENTAVKLLRGVLRLRRKR